MTEKAGQFRLDIKSSTGAAHASFLFPEIQTLPLVEQRDLDLTNNYREEIIKLQLSTGIDDSKAMAEITVTSKCYSKPEWLTHVYKQPASAFKDIDHGFMGCANSGKVKFIFHVKICQEQEGTNGNYMQYFNSEDLSDFSIVCSDEVTLPAHQVVLAANSDVFKAMLEAQLTESEENSVTIDDVDSETMLELLRFMYCGKVENHKVIITKLLHAADKYAVEKVKEICGSAMAKELSVETVMEFCAHAYRYRMSNLLSECFKFVKNNYHYVRKQEDVTILDVDLLGKLLDYCMAFKVQE